MEGNAKNKEFTIKVYTQKQYDKEMRELLKEKGLHGAVEEFTDKINDIAVNWGYVAHMDVVEFLNDILFLIDIHEVDNGKHE